MNNNQPIYIKVPKVHQIGTTVHVKESNSQTQSTSKWNKLKPKAKPNSSTTQVEISDKIDKLAMRNSKTHENRLFNKFKSHRK